MSEYDQIPTTCACCGVNSTEGSATLCYQCEDEAIDRPRDDNSGCPIRARWDRRMQTLAAERSKGAM